MKGYNMNKNVKWSIRKKLFIQSVFVALPFLIVAIVLIVSMVDYNMKNERIVSSMTVANNYNLNFKNQMDESLYKLVVGYTDFDNIQMDDTLVDPYLLIGNMRRDFTQLFNTATEEECKVWLTSLLNNIDTLEKRVDDIKFSLENGGSYSANIEKLDNNIYILTYKTR